MFDGFERANIHVGETTIFVRHKGSGPPLLLLHGFPQTHVMWRHAAPALAERFAVVCADLRGYGASGTPESTADHAPYAKRAMARDMVKLMASLGHERFAVVGHNRGGRVAYRMALDHPDRVERAALLDVIPTGDALDRADARLALGYWPWSLLAQPAPLPERLLLGCPEAIVDDALANWGSDGAAADPDARAAYVAPLRDERTVHAICEEYRAAATLDAEVNRADRRTGHRIACPVRVMWGAGGPLDTWYEDAGGPLGIWPGWAADVRGRAMPGGHFFPEDNPVETLAEIERFMGR